MSRKRNVAIASFGVLAIGAGAIYFEGKAWLQQTLRREANARGFEQLGFSLSSVGPRGVTFKDISLPGAAPLHIDSVTIDYSLTKLAHGDVDQIAIPEVQLDKEGTKLTAHEVLFSFEPSEHAVQHGTWDIEELLVDNKSLPMPKLAGSGNWSLENGRIKLDGHFESADKSYLALFSLDYNSADIEHSQLTLTSVRLPWNGGVVAIKNAGISLAPGKTITVPLQLSGIPLDTVLKAATGDKAEATGKVSGSVPLIILPSGQVTVGEGKLQTGEDGIIKLSPEAIPGDNPQVALVRDVLQNFHYNQFSMGFEQGKDKQLSILLSLGGNNPDAYNGREVKLNVHLSGDLLDLLQQSIMPMADPKQYLKGQHEK